MKRPIRSSKPDWQKQIAKERIDILFREAKNAFPDHKDRSNRYVEIARAIGKRFRIKIPTALKRQYCKNCYRYIKIGVNARVRLRPEKGARVITCLECNKQMRYQYK